MNHSTRPREAATRVPRVATASVLVAAVLLAVHTVMTFLHVAPVNPAKVEWETAVTRWVSPVFEQNWKLFAPDPIAIDQGVLIRTDAEGAGLSGGGEFVDITTPYLLEKHHNLVPTRSGYQLSGVLTRFIDARDALVADRSDSDNLPLFLPSDLVANADERLAALYRQGEADLQRSAVSHLGEQPVETRFQIRVVLHTFARWSDRANDGVGDIAHATSEWFTTADIAEPLEARP